MIMYSKIKQFSIVSVILFILPIICGTQLFAQINKSTENVQKDMLEKANIAYDRFNYIVAPKYYKEYLNIENSRNRDVLLKLADSYWWNCKYREALRVYKQLFSTDTIGTTKTLQLRIGELYARFCDYEHASQWLRGVDGYKAKADVYGNVADLEALKKDSLGWTIRLLDTNTLLHEFSPCLANNSIYFSSNRFGGLDNKSKIDERRLNYSKLWKVSLKDVNSNLLIDKVSGETNDNVSMVDGFKDIKFNTAPVSIDKQNHLYFSTNSNTTDNNNNIGIKRLVLMEASYNSNGHLKKRIMPFGDSKSYSVMHPAISADGTFLVFSSDKHGGQGGYDLYYSQRSSYTQPWDEVKPFASNVNTTGNEVFPTITSNGYLYFSSDALPGLGGLDIFRITLKDAIIGIGIPEHLSYPINSSHDDFGWAQGEMDTKNYFTSDRLGDNDIFSCSFNESFRNPNLNSGNSKSSKSVILLDNQTAMINLTNAIVGSVVFRTDLKKKYILSALPASSINNWIEIVTVHKDDVSGLDYTTKTDTFSSKNNSLKETKSNSNTGICNSNKSRLHLTNMPISAIPYIDSKYVYSILFNTNKCDITPSNYYLMNALVGVMKKYSCLKLLIKSYTDAVGGDVYNLNLSKLRATYARNYLTSRGIELFRLDTLCLGKKQQLNENRTAVEKAINRRVLFQAKSNGCNMDVDSLLSIELENHIQIHYRKIFILEAEGKYMVQLGAFKTIIKATALAEKIESFFPNSVYLSNDNNYYKVRIGASKTAIEALKIASIIEAMGFLD